MPTKRQTRENNMKKRPTPKTDHLKSEDWRELEILWVASSMVMLTWDPSEYSSLANSCMESMANPLTDVHTELTLSTREVT